MSSATVTASIAERAERAGSSGADDERYSQLFEKLRRPATGMVRRAFGATFSDDELEDLYSSAWLSTLAALDRKSRRLSDDELRRYLLTAVANQASREMRRRGRKPTVPLEVAVEASDRAMGPEERAAQAEHDRVTREVLGSLPPRRRAVLVFRYGWDLEPTEVCNVVGGLSPRAYRKEIERGVAEVASKMRMVEEGSWCESREPLLRAVAAGLADDEEQRQAERHLAHCRSCAGFVSRLSGHLHDLGSSVALVGAAESLGSQDGSLVDRGAAVLDRGKQAVGSLFNRGSEAAEHAAGQIAASGGTRGAGVAGAGAVAKLAGLGAVPKIVAACVGTGAAATACVAAGVVPGLGTEREPAREPARAERPVDPDRSETRRHVRLSVVDPIPPVPVAPETPPPEAGTPGSEEPPVPTAPEPAPEPTPAPEPPPPTAQEFEPVGTPVGGAAPATSSPASGSGGGSGGSSGGDFGP